MLTALLLLYLTITGRPCMVIATPLTSMVQSFLHSLEVLMVGCDI